MSSMSQNKSIGFKISISFNIEFGSIFFLWDCTISLRNYLGADGSYIDGYMIAFTLGQYFVIKKKIYNRNGR